MAISFITGKPGGGKGLLAMQQVIDELLQGTRPIITNLAVRVEPWVNGSHQPMIGLRSYLLKAFGKHFDCDKRIHILPDEEIAAFYLWRVVDGKLVKSNYNAKKTRDGDEIIIDFDTANGATSGPCMYVVDEAWKFYGSRNWQRTGEGVLFYNAQHRKFGDDVLIVTQHTKQIDPAVQRVAQDFWVVRNHSKLSIGMFRQPDVFSVAIYECAPTGSQQEPMTRKLFRLDKKGIAQTYDTSAGVGLSGRMVADIGGRRKGLPWWGILILAVAIIFALSQAPKLLGTFTSWMMHSPKKVSKPAQQVALSARRTNSPAQTEDSLRDSAQQQAVLPKSTSENTDTNLVVCTGYVYFPHHILVQLSDGRTADSMFGEVQRINPRQVTVFNEVFPVQHLLNSQIAYSPAPSMYQPDYSQLQTDNQQSLQQSQPVTVIGQNWKSRNTASPVNGFGNSTIANRMGQSAGGTVQQGSYP
ncbi:MAG TPA: zonular occludens toxin domain-containing protein [Verrucomicrobiae bacterium]|nr:zonular occludens toxin domain-containing protein [Verrucomicrobiae bacterium]